MDIVGVPEREKTLVVMAYSPEYIKRATDANLPELWIGASFAGTTEIDKRWVFSAKSEEELAEKLPELQAQAEKDGMILQIFAVS